MAEVDATRTCVVCGVLFPRNGKTLMCSPECVAARYREYQRRDGRVKGPQQLTCKRCGAGFVGVASKTYCSTTCRNAWRNHSAPPGIRDRLKRRASNKAARDKARAIGGRDRTSDRIRAKRMGVVTLTRQQLAAIRREFSDCPYCGIALRSRHIDHMDPISCGGIHAPSNLVVCCATCNLRKGAMLFANWTQVIDPARRAMVVDMYERKRSNRLLMAA